MKEEEYMRKKNPPIAFFFLLIMTKRAPFDTELSNLFFFTTKSKNHFTYPSLSKLKMANITFKHPTTILIAGSTGSGKTHLTCEIIKHKNVLFSSPPTVTIFFYKVENVKSLIASFAFPSNNITKIFGTLLMAITTLGPPTVSSSTCGSSIDEEGTIPLDATQGITVTG